MSQQPTRATRGPASAGDLAAALAQRVVGQHAATEAIVPYVEMYQAGLSPEGRPVGVFLLLGPTGTGKTKTVEALAEALHGSEKSLVRIDCGEFQLEHEVAKLIGAPPGYLGHRETQPILTGQKLAAATSEHSGLSIVLFDEIEKAAPSMTRLLLGVLDKATLRLGDNSTVNFENSLIFLTSNLGARDMSKELHPDFGFRSADPSASPRDLSGKIESIGMHAVRKRFSPEFVNRIDRVVSYQPLGAVELEEILELGLQALAAHVRRKLGHQGFSLVLTTEGRRLLLTKGTSREYGARELNRTIHRHLLQPIASMVVRGQVPAGSHLIAHPSPSGDRLEISRASVSHAPILLIAQSGASLPRFLEIHLAKSGLPVVAAGSAAEALEKLGNHTFRAAVIDQRPDDPGAFELGGRLREAAPHLPVIVLSALSPTAVEESEFAAEGLYLLRKPFLAAELAEQVRRIAGPGNSGALPLRVAG